MFNCVCVQRYIKCIGELENVKGLYYSYCRSTALAWHHLSSKLHVGAPHKDEKKKLKL